MEDGLSSMTGYGSTTAQVEGWRLRVECRSINHRALSVRLHVPEELRWIEPPVMRKIKDVIARGRVEFRVDLTPGVDDKEIDFEGIDEERFASVAIELKRLALQYRLRAPVSLQEVCEYRSFFERTTRDLFSEESSELVMPVMETAVEKMLASRREEGAGICRDIEQYLQQLKNCLGEVDELKEEDESAHRTRVQDRLRQALVDFDIGEISDGRLAQEVAYYVEKGDISEELQRARAHVDKLGVIVDSADGEAVGKKIDFYLQELIRETNTMGAKSQYARLTDLVIEMKSLVEKMREQAANIE